MNLVQLQSTYKVPDFKGLLETARERGFSDDQIASCIKVFFTSHENQILRSLSQTISLQQEVINSLVDVEKKDKFIKYITDCINDGITPYSVLVSNWGEFFDE